MKAASKLFVILLLSGSLLAGCSATGSKKGYGYSNHGSSYGKHY